MTTRISLPRFKAALAAFEDVIPSGTYWRYRNGILPLPLGTLLINNPELAMALARDAEELQAKQKQVGAMEGTDQ
jgi:hypothetical protein